MASGRPKIALLASGGGTTAESIVHATQSGILRAEVGLVVTNNVAAGVIGRIARLNTQYDLKIPVEHISGKTHPGDPGMAGEQTLEESEAIARLCRGFSLVSLVGYMKKVRGPLLTQKLVNTHPGPLPETAGTYGIHAQERVLELGLSHSAQTLHLVDNDYDHGRILMAHAVPVMPDDTPETLFDAVQGTEKAHLAADLNMYLYYGL